jgi:hypothetical protein
LDKPLDLINPKLGALAKRISESRPEDPAMEFQFSGIGFFPRPEVHGILSPFIFERKQSTDWAENRYYTRAPLQTDAHIQLLNELEAILA